MSLMNTKLICKGIKKIKILQYLKIMNLHQLLVNSQNKPPFTLTSTLLFARHFHLKGRLFHSL